MSFRRRTATSKSAPLPPGTRLLGSSTALVTSTGIPSLDDVLGGGIPLSNALAILCPNPHASHGDLIQKHFISQGLLSQHQVLVCDPSHDPFYESSIWVRDTPTSAIAEAPADDGVNIAWRYKHMKQFQTTVADDDGQADGYRHPLDLTARLPAEILQQSIACNQLLFLPSDISKPYQILEHIIDLFHKRKSGSEPSVPLRISLRNVGSPEWGFSGRQDLLRFLFALRGVIKSGEASGSIVLATLPPHLSDDSRELHWVSKVSNVCDASMTFEAFEGKQWLEEAFKTHHGLVRIHRLPCPLTMSPPSDRTSMLRGLRQGGVGENNLVFRCTRRRLVIETLHLDVEGGVGERRTTAPPAEKSAGGSVRAGMAAVEIEIEGTKERKTKQVKFEAIDL